VDGLILSEGKRRISAGAPSVEKRFSNPEGVVTEDGSGGGGPRDAVYLAHHKKGTRKREGITLHAKST